MATTPLKRSNAGLDRPETPSKSTEAHREDPEPESAGSDVSEDETQPEPPQKRQKSAEKDLQIARETAELFRLNIFQLQIDELVKEVKLEEHKMESVTKFLHKLYDSIQAIEACDPVSADQIASIFATETGHPKIKKITVPFADPKPTNVKYTFAYSPPTDVQLVGLFGLKTGIQLPFYNTVDLAVEMPNELFEKKDYLNYRAFHKRAFYLAYLTKTLVQTLGKELKFLKFRYEYMNGDVLTPTLRIDSLIESPESPYNFGKQRFLVRVTPSFPYGLFDGRKLAPEKNNVRLPVADAPPTPLYNAALITSSCYTHYLKLLYSAKKTAENFHSACVLGRLWLLQRGFKLGGLNYGGFGHFEYALLTALLLKGGGASGLKTLLSGYSAYQLFKGVVKYIAETDLMAGHLLFSLEPSIGHVTYHPEGFNIPAVFDKTTGLNVLWKMLPSSYDMLRHEARLTLAQLSLDLPDSFDSVFLRNSDVSWLKYDLALEMPVPSSDTLLDTIGFDSSAKIAFVSYENYVRNRIYTILRTGLGKRVRALKVSIKDHLHPEYAQVSGVRTPVHRRRPELDMSTCSVHIGLVLDPAEAEKLVVFGPLASSEDAKEFVLFWGGRASLRKFKDGTICHCVVFEASNERPVALQMVQHLFLVHLDAFCASRVVLVGLGAQKWLPVAALAGAKKSLPTASLGFTALRSSFDGLQKTLLLLTGLPMPVKNVLPAGPAFRVASTLTPVPWAVANPDFFQDAIIEFESLLRWPDRLAALEAAKTAFLVKIHKSLPESYRSLLEHDTKSVPLNKDVMTLCVVTPEGFGFRLRVLTERDEILYLRATLNAPKDLRPVLEDTYLSFVRKYIANIKHTRSVSSAAFRHLFFPPVVRLFKRWLDNQLLLCHLNDELVELIALKVFVEPGAWCAPSGVSNGFFRVLDFLARWNWKEEPLILDTSRTEPGEEYDQFSGLLAQLRGVMTANFERVRKQDPLASKTQFFVASKDDQSGILYGSNIPMPIATRLTALARAAVGLVEKEGVEKALLKIFKPALQDYDFVVRLGGDYTEKSGVLTENSYRNLTSLKSLFDTELVDSVVDNADPAAAFVEELNEKYSNIALFSFHKYPGLDRVVTGIFNPAVNTEKNFRVNLGYNVKPKAEGVILNKEAVYDDILKMGGDLVVGFD